MLLDDYQHAASTTATPAARTLSYLVLGLCGEAGEIADHAKKVLRDDGGSLTVDRQRQLLAEVGDCLWYIASICTTLDVSLSQVAESNLAKLKDRHARGVICGAGDAR